MANHPSALKRAKQNEKRRNRNRAEKTRVKSVVKAVRLAAAGKSKEDGLKELDNAKSIIDKTAGKGNIHRKTASRKISRLSKLINATP